jgi:MATE family multidrug resistance protein
METNAPKILTYRQHARDILVLSLPVVAGQIGMTLLGQTDALMIGKLGHVHLSAANLANSVFYILTVVCFGITYAISSLVSEAMGSGEPAKAGLFLRQGVWAGILVAALTTALGYFSADLLPYMGQPPADVALAQPFLRIIGLSTPFMVGFIVYKQYADGLSRTLPGMVITMGMVVLNVLLNYLLIEGHWGLPRLELEGAGWATLFSRLAGMLAFMGYVHGTRAFQGYGGGFTAHVRPEDRPYFSWRPHGGTIAKILSLGLPMGFQFFFEVAAFAGVAFIIGWQQDASVARAAHQIALGVVSFTFMVVMGIATGASVRVGTFKGMGDRENLLRAGLSGIGLSVVFMGLATVAVLVFRHRIGALYGIQEPEVLRLVAGLMLIVAVFEILDGVQGTASGLLRGLQDVRFPTVLTFVAYWLVSLPLSYWLALPMGWGVYGAWTAFIFSLAIVAVGLSARFWYLAKRI